MTEPAVTAPPLPAPEQDGPVEAVVAPARASASRIIIGLVISAVSVAGVVWWALNQDAPRFPSQPAELALLVAAVATYAAATLVRGWRWHVILRRAHIAHQAVDAYALTVVGYMGNTVLPARGGEVLRILLLGERSSARRREILGSIIPERILDAAALGVLLIVLTLMNTGGTPAGDAPALLAAGLIAAGILAGFVYLRLRTAGRMEGFAARVRPVARASRTLFSLTGLGLALATLGVWLLEAVIFWMVGASLDLAIDLGEALLVIALASLAGLVPAGPGYVGTYDAGLLFALRAVDVTSGAALSALLLFRFVIFVPITVVGLVLMVTRYGGLHRMLRRTPA